jgi:hypothetical protein
MWKMPLEKIDPTITKFQIMIRNNLGENIELANFCDGKNQVKIQDLLTGLSLERTK